ncbi:MAG: hypothetical protein JNG90_16105 [Planctomycetaceae bacterium]|nr:hypothetical protein [Planctomycetaceae bacterium]
MSTGLWIGVVAAVVAALAVAGALWRPLRAARREARLARARQQFKLQRERLEAKFFSLAASSGKPRGLRWVDCDFDNLVTYARDRKSGQLSAFVGVTISFEAIEGGLMEGVEAVGNLRAATAVFIYGRQGWETQGRVMFNLNPSEAIAYYVSLVELVGNEGLS